jgi:hypothetical protein
MRLSLTIIAISLLTSCITIPIPPSGEHQGKLGSLKLSISYSPYQTQTAKVNPNTKYAWEHFSKTMKDKR